jgi:hypothetical protein
MISQAGAIAHRRRHHGQVVQRDDARQVRDVGGKGAEVVIVAGHARSEIGSSA